MKTTKDLGGIFRESLGFFFRNILRLTGVAAWISVPASMIFVLFFFWGLEEQSIYLLMRVASFVAVFLLVLLLIVAIKTIQILDQRRKAKILSVYAESFEVFFHFLTVLARLIGAVFLRALWVFLPGLFFIWGLKTFNKKWMAGISPDFITTPVVILGLGIGAMFSFCYFLAPFALLIDGKAGREALVYSKTLIKPRSAQFVLGNFLMLTLLAPVYFLIQLWAGKVYDIPIFPENLFPILFHVPLVNLFAVVMNIFPLVFLYFFYKEAQGQAELH